MFFVFALYVTNNVLIQEHFFCFMLYLKGTDNTVKVYVPRFRIYAQVYLTMLWTIKLKENIFLMKKISKILNELQCKIVIILIKCSWYYLHVQAAITMKCILSMNRYVPNILYVQICRTT